MVEAVLASGQETTHTILTRSFGDITKAILDGGQPRDLTADKLLAHSRLPLGWHEQRTVLGIA